MGLLDFFRKPKPQLPADLQAKMKAIAAVAFPNGHKDIQEGGITVRKLARDKLSQQEAESLFATVKTLLIISEDKSAETIKASITGRTAHKLTEPETQAVYQFITGDPGGEPYSGADGSSKDAAVVINYTLTSQGVDAEYRYLEQHFGLRGKGWTIERRAHGEHGNRYIEWFDIRLSSGATRTIFFDITAFFGRL